GGCGAGGKGKVRRHLSGPQHAQDGRFRVGKACAGVIVERIHAHHRGHWRGGPAHDEKIIRRRGYVLPTEAPRQAEATTTVQNCTWHHVRRSPAVRTCSAQYGGRM